MSVEETKARLVPWLQSELKLEKIACPEPHQVEGQDECFIVDASAEEWGSRLTLLSAKLRPVSEWRDNYGVLGRTFQFDNQPHTVSLGFVRINKEHWLYEGPEYARVREREYPGYVTVRVFDEPLPDQ